MFFVLESGVHATLTGVLLADHPIVDRYSVHRRDTWKKLHLGGMVCVTSVCVRKPMPFANVQIQQLLHNILILHWVWCWASQRYFLSGMDWRKVGDGVLARAFSWMSLAGRVHRCVHHEFIHWYLAFGEANAVQRFTFVLGYFPIFGVGHLGLFYLHRTHPSLNQPDARIAMTQPKTQYLKDYQQPAFECVDIHLSFDLNTLINTSHPVRAVYRQTRDLCLHGEHLELLQLKITVRMYRQRAVK